MIGGLLLQTLGLRGFDVGFSLCSTGFRRGFFGVSFALRDVPLLITGLASNALGFSAAAFVPLVAGDPGDGADEEQRNGDNDDDQNNSVGGHDDSFSLECGGPVFGAGISRGM